MKSVSRGWLGSEMLTRRTATVTISAPDAATAAAFSSRLLYLPVPTISRDVNVRPATVQLSDCNDCGAFKSASTNEMHNLEGIALGDQTAVQRAARHDLQISLDGHLARVHAKVRQHLGNTSSGRGSPLFAVNPD